MFPLLNSLWFLLFVNGNANVDKLLCIDTLMIKRFRKEVRAREDIVPFGTVILSNAPERSANTLAATLLLQEIFADRITIQSSPQGLLCGSREEQAALRLSEFTRQGAPCDLLLRSLTASEIEKYLANKTGVHHTVFVPDTAEVRFVRRLSDEFPDVLFGL